VPWFLQDLGTYGIGIFTPTILAAAVGANEDHARSIADLIQKDITAARGAALITALLIVGIIFAILLADVVGRISLQILGFIGCAVGLLLASLSTNFSGGASILLIFSGFMLFNFMTNLGPNAQTYLLAGRGLPHADPRPRRRLCRCLRQDRRGPDRILLPHPSHRHRDASAALRPDRDLAAWRGGHLGFPDRDDRREPRHSRALETNENRGAVCRPLANARRDRHRRGAPEGTKRDHDHRAPEWRGGGFRESMTGDRL
jgi:hypothetical protein